jgi:uncharacterized membrane protein
MTETTAGRQEPESFRAVLTPYRSLGATGFLILMSAIGLVSFVMGVAFLLLGAWPVMGFFGLDALLIYVAFRLNYRSGRAFETVELTPDLLTLTRVEPSGARARFEFNPYWVRVLLSERPDGRTELRLASHGREYPFARFLTDDERREFAKALTGALSKARVSFP